MKAYSLLSCLLTIAILSGCGQTTTSTIESEMEELVEVDSFTVNNAEIKQDIINELIAQSIEYWINTDASIGFNLRDAERIDAIGYEAIGAYAARN
ncbi:MAG: hypothetical protein P8K27_05100 [Gammaproteobacteria bacterium]|nr:hypothetical protein [Gammaproteobacteria bacterium]